MTELLEMQAEFECTRLEVALVPARRPANYGACIRVAVSKNCTWYRSLCAQHLSSRMRNKRLPDTRIKRKNISRVLEHLIARGVSRSKYAQEILKLASQRSKVTAQVFKLRSAA
jgi:hypothetical protein